MKYPNITKSNALLNKMKIDLHMLGALMLNGVGEHIDSTDVVTIDQHCLGQGSMQLSKQLAQLGGFNNDVNDSTVLSFNTTARNRMLAFGGP